MLTIKVEGLDELRKSLEQFSDRRFQSAVAEAINKTARHVSDAWGGQFATKFDRPTAMTYRASVIPDRADVGRLSATVSLRDSIPNNGVAPAEYLATHESGAADRGLRKFESKLAASGAIPRGHKLVPGTHAKLDNFGNVSRAQVIAVLNQLSDPLKDGYQSVISRNKGKRDATAAKQGRRYVPVPRAIGKLEAGIYERKGRLLLPVFFIVSTTRYRKTLDLMALGRRAASDVLGREVSRAVEKRIASLARRATA